MATISKVPVLLTVEETETLLRILSNYSSTNWNHANRTKSAAIRDYSQREGTKASELESELVKRLYIQS